MLHKSWDALDLWAHGQHCIKNRDDSVKRRGYYTGVNVAVLQLLRHVAATEFNSILKI